MLLLDGGNLLFSNQSISWEDVNGDTWVDLLIGNYLWINYSGILREPILLDVGAKHSVFVDFDNDNDFDILFFGGKGVFLFSNELGDFHFTKYFENLPIINPNALCISDYNNDKFPDIFIAQLWSKYPKPLPNFLLENLKIAITINKITDFRKK